MMRIVVAAALADQALGVGREAHGLGAQVFDARGAEHLERGQQGRGREDRRIAHGPAGGAGRGTELRQHLEARLGLMSPPARQSRRRAFEVLLVHEAAGDRAGTGVQVLVRAPHREIDIPVVQLQRQVADGMRQVEAGDGADVVRGARDARAVEGLAGAVLHARPQHQRELAAELVDLRFDVLDAQRFFAGARRELDQRFLGFELVPGELPEDGVPVGGERAGLDQHLVAHADRPIERGHHQVQVHGERIHRDDFARQRAGQVRAGPW